MCFKGRNNHNLEIKFLRVPNRTIGRNTVTYSNLVVGPEESTCRAVALRALSLALSSSLSPSLEMSDLLKKRCRGGRKNCACNNYHGAVVERRPSYAECRRFDPHWTDFCETLWLSRPLLIARFGVEVVAPFKSIFVKK